MTLKRYDPKKVRVTWRDPKSNVVHIITNPVQANRREVFGQWVRPDWVFPLDFISMLLDSGKVTDAEAFAMSQAAYEDRRPKVPRYCSAEVPEWALAELERWKAKG